MLEIGAVQHDNYANQTSWIDNSPIDLHSQHPDILEQDFFVRPIPTTEEKRFDIISCSLVLNFVETPARRGTLCSPRSSHAL
jgi:25S rRNA (adenine2142-N1)-methyltransferase